MDSATYRHLLGQIKKSCHIPHYNFPTHNLLSVETLLRLSKDFKGDVSECDAEFLTNFPCYEPFPYAVQLSSVLFCGSGATDDATDLVKRKLNWEKKLKNLRMSNIDTAVYSIKRLRENKTVKLTNNLKKYIEHFHCDPEPMFSGNYNWLYTGGCLCCDKKFDGTNLICADFFAKKPGFSVLELTETQDKVMQKSFCQLKTFSPVLQITCKPHKENLIICVRQKNYLNIFNVNRLNSLSQPVRLWRKKVSGSKLLTCIDVETNCEEIVVTDSNHDINVFHMEGKNKINGHSGRKIASDFAKDAWSQVEFGDHGVYWALRNCFVIFDLRDFSSGAKLKYEPSSAANPCENISSFAKSPTDSNFLYLSTTHSVLQVDLRNGKAVQKWTHLMKNPPQFLTTLKDKEESEVLLLQSPSVDEISGIINERKKDGDSVSFVSRSLPCLLSTIKESLNLARFRGKCLNPSVAKRVDFPVTGMQCLKNNQGEIILYTTNSGGDIFFSKIKDKTESFQTDENEVEIMNAMEIYESHLEKFPLKKSIKGHVKLVDMSRVVEDFQKSKVKIGKAEKYETYWKFHEMYSSESLKLFRDVLAQKILNVWCPDDSRMDELDSEDEIMSVEEKVREWMDKY